MEFPQESILGPLLVIININDIVNSSKLAKLLSMISVICLYSKKNTTRSSSTMAEAVPVGDLRHVGVSRVPGHRRQAEQQQPGNANDHVALRKVFIPDTGHIYIYIYIYIYNSFLPLFNEVVFEQRV